MTTTSNGAEPTDELIALRHAVNSVGRFARGRIAHAKAHGLDHQDLFDVLTVLNDLLRDGPTEFTPDIQGDPVDPICVCGTEESAHPSDHSFVDAAPELSDERSPAKTERFEYAYLRGGRIVRGPVPDPGWNETIDSEEAIQRWFPGAVAMRRTVTSFENQTSEWEPLG